MSEKLSPYVKTAVDDWLSETEGYSLRQERTPEGSLPWIYEAARVAAAAERERCALVAEETTRTICRDHFIMGGPMGLGLSVSAAIRLPTPEKDSGDGRE